MLDCVEGDIAAQPDFDAIGPGLDRQCGRSRRSLPDTPS